MAKIYYTLLLLLPTFKELLQSVFLVYITLSSDVFLFPIWTLKRNQKYKVKTKPKKTQYTFGDCDCFQSGDNFFHSHYT